MYNWNTNMDQKPLSIKRQIELQNINRVLAALVVILSFTSGILMAIQEEWIKEPFVLSAGQPTGNPDSVKLDVEKPENNQLSELMMNARWQRTISSDPIDVLTLTRILWFAQGKITNWGERTVPSYRSIFPVKLRVIIRNVDGIDPGLYEFEAESQQLTALNESGNIYYPEMFPALINSPVLIFSVIENRNETEPMIWHEAGAISQNLLLAAVDQGLSAFLLPIESLDKSFTSQFINQEKSVLWFMPMGKPLTE